MLVVEDDEDARELIAVHVAAMGCEAIQAADGDSALQALETQDPDVLVLDLGLPGIDGFEVLRRVRDRPAPREIPALVLTGRMQTGDVARARELGANDYLTKPFQAEQLLLRLTRLLVWAKRIRAAGG